MQRFAITLGLLTTTSCANMGALDLEPAPCSEEEIYETANDFAAVCLTATHTSQQCDWAVERFFGQTNGLPDDTKLEYIREEHLIRLADEAQSCLTTGRIRGVVESCPPYVRTIEDLDGDFDCTTPAERTANRNAQIAP